MNINSAFKSNYLKQADIGSKRVLVTIDHVAVETIEGDKGAEEKAVIYFAGHERGLVCNRTNADEIVSIIGDAETDNWRGKRVVLYVDPKVMFGGKKVGGIRVAAPPAGGSRPAPPPPVEEVSDSFEADESDVPFAFTALVPFLPYAIAAVSLMA